MSRLSFFNDIFLSVFTRSEASGDVLDGGSLAELSGELLSGRGEMSGLRLARTLLARFEEADEAERLAFFVLLAERFDIDAEHIERAARRYGETPSAANLEALMEGVEPRRQELLRRLNQVPGATVRLVRMRECLLELTETHPALERLDLDFRHLFRSWFNRGFLVLREIDWNTPANVLERIIAYEAVHAIGSWAELRARLEPPDRRCFAFFHPAMPDEPLIFVEVALTRALPESVRAVIGPDREPLSLDDVDTAVFYSISNCQGGLAGVSFGNFLIKQVAAELSRELPQLSVFRTLSPVPGFMRWVRRAATAVDRSSADAAPADGAPADGAPVDERSVDVDDLALAESIADASEAPALDEEGRLRLSRLLARYLVLEKRDDGRPLDPVARFHLGNGAEPRRRAAGGGPVPARAHPLGGRHGQLSLRPRARRVQPRALRERSRGDHVRAAYRAARPSQTLPETRLSTAANPLFDAFLAGRARGHGRLLERDDGGMLDDAAFLALAARIAATLAAAGVEPGDRVAVQVAKSPEALALYVGCVQAGAVFLPLNTAYTEPELAYFVGERGARRDGRGPRGRGARRAAAGGDRRRRAEGWAARVHARGKRERFADRRVGRGDADGRRRGAG